MTSDDRYTLSTGELGAYRLSILNHIHKPYTEFLFRRVGLESGMVVADIGCGTGNVSHWLAQAVGINGAVFGVDISAAQLEQAKLNADIQGLSNIKFVEGSAYEPGLPQNSFDVVYCRFLLSHLTKPTHALKKMLELVKPGGILVCEEVDISCSFCDPPSPAYDRCIELFLAISDLRGQHFRLGASLYRCFSDIGLAAPEVCMIQSVISRGEGKHIVDLSLREGAAALIAAELTTQAEIDQMLIQLRALADDDTTAFGIFRVTQAWARNLKPL
ncbi:class I SAM-dependent methyltransferase [Fortiea contorta]|uniref:class I SAM-dependent methyltransferase n=1 Tax=Fortiea contorta TaxID=1892405 RepID=UPI00034664F0|nr:methyltransferase domain-containing protein [Fortiea contorta]